MIWQLTRFCLNPAVQAAREATIKTADVSSRGFSRAPGRYRMRVLAGLLSLGFLWHPLRPACADQKASVQQEPHAPGGVGLTVVPNRVVPAHSAPSAAFSIPNDPTEDDIKHARLFEESLLAVEGTPSPEQNRRLGAVLFQHSQRPVADDFSELEQFVAAYPDSPWTPSLLFNLGLEYYKTGWYSKALGAFEKAWPLLKPSGDPAVKAVADRAVGELAMMYARVGRMKELSGLLDSIKGLVLRGPGTDKVARASQGLWTMQHHPEIAFRCGPLALDRIIAFKNPGKGGLLLIQNSSSTTNGISLSQVAAFSQKAGLNYQMAFRSKGAVLLMPAVVNWKIGHYAALLREEDGLYLLQDPTFHNETWVTARALEDETTGYFLVPPGGLPTGWRPVSQAEGMTVWGKGTTENSEPNAVTPHDKKPCSALASAGMAVCSVHLLDVSLNIQDNPVGYAPPVGPTVRFVVNYNQRESDQPAVFNYSNLGAQWTFNYLAFITDQPNSPGADVDYYTDGGGTLPFPTVFDPISQSFSFAPQIKSHATLTRTSSSSYQMVFRDGSRYIFALPGSISGISRRVYLTQMIDPQGNSVQISYDSSFRVVAVSDAIGQVTTLSYQNPSDSLKITKVTDPFGRFATFNYDASNRLAQITDCIGLTSQFTYDSGDNILAMTTPYGTTSFAFGQNGRDTWLETTYPDGEKERTEFTESTTVGTDSQDPPSTLPKGMWTRDWVMYARNTYFWDRNAYPAYAANTSNYSTAYNYHWLHDPTLTTAMGVLETEKAPLENRIWYNYAGQDPGNENATVIGASSQPSVIGRVLDDGSTQLRQFSYNALGNLVNSIDPLGRSMTYIYASNLVDLLAVRQTTGTNNDLLATTYYNSTHLPIAIYDAAGQVTTDTYNARGQILSSTDPIHGMITFSYDTNGYLLTITGPLQTTNDQVRFTYDGIGRVRTATDTEGYTVTYSYDNLDRVTNILHPDGTFEAFAYNRLDRVMVQDRLGRQTLATFDALRRLIAMQDPLNRVTRFEYCGCGSPAALFDPMGRQTIWRHDVQGRLASTQYPDGSQITYNYENTTSRLKSVADEQGQLKVYSYYADDHQQSISYPNAQIATPTVTFNYDPSYDRMMSMQDGIGTTTWSYYPAGVLGALRVSAVAGPWTNSMVTYQYDALTRVTNWVINGVARADRYDALSRITNAANALGSFSYDYDGATGRLLDAFYPNGQSSHFTYFDSLGDHRLRQIAHQAPNASVISSFAYAYNAFGEITNWAQQLSSLNQTWSIGYDAADQVSSVAQGGPNAVNYSYSYDAAANRLLESSNNVQRTFNYNALNQLLSSSDTNAPTVTYQWDAEQRLAGTIQGSNQSRFFYDGRGRRLRITQTSGNVIQADRRFVWCGPEICEEWNSNNVVVNRYFHQGEQQNGTNLFYTRDHLGSVRELTDTNGAIRAQISYAPYGAATKLQGDLTPNFLFTGHFAQPGSGLLLALYRAYDPSDARWLSRDPIPEHGGINLYNYAENNPISSVDPFGATTITSQKPFPGMDSPLGPPYTKTIDDGHDHTQTLWSIDQSGLCGDEMNVYNKLQNKSSWDAWNPRDEATFDSGYSGGNPERWYYLYQGNFYADNEINYFGIGMYEAWKGNSYQNAVDFTERWKFLKYGELPSQATLYWLKKGYEDYKKIHDTGKPPCASK